MTKILLVEDDKSLREIYGVRLLAEGYDIVSAGDGEEALAMAIKERPQLIVSDVMMPKISGFDMLDILRSTSETKNIKVIMMTALSSEDQRARGEALGADRYLVKSQVGIEDVVRAVHEVLGDIPTPTPTPSQTYGGPAAVPAQPEAAAANPMPYARTAPTQSVVPNSAPVASPAQPARPSSDAGLHGSVDMSGGLPQPTAPFSTPRPAGFGERVIHPINQPGQQNGDLSSRLNEELSTSQPAQANPVVPPPPVPPVPDMNINYEETPRPPYSDSGSNLPPQPPVSQ